MLMCFLTNGSVHRDTAPRPITRIFPSNFISCPHFFGSNARATLEFFRAFAKEASIQFYNAICQALHAEIRIKNAILNKIFAKGI
jgi:hypothetical protein